MALEGEPPGEPDQRGARAYNRFSRLAGEGGRNGRMRATGRVLACVAQGDTGGLNRFSR